MDSTLFAFHSVLTLLRVGARDSERMMNLIISIAPCSPGLSQTTRFLRPSHMVVSRWRVFCRCFACAIESPCRCDADCQFNQTCNLDLNGLTSLQVLDKVVAAAGARGINVVFDLHSFEPDASPSNGLWCVRARTEGVGSPLQMLVLFALVVTCRYDSTHSETQVIAGWQALASRYASYSNILGADLKNAPFQGTWATGNAATGG